MKMLGLSWNLWSDSRDHDLFHKLGSLRIPSRVPKSHCPPFSQLLSIDIWLIFAASKVWIMPMLRREGRFCVALCSCCLVHLENEFVKQILVWSLLLLLLGLVLLWRHLNANKILLAEINFKNSVENSSRKGYRLKLIGDGQFRFTCESRFQTLLYKYN